ncbi:prepilin-type N-terminal cleavage/methylation domain-containing protein [Vibrio splendidus]|uniref:prepilin-type N-terminal cleavage/methylation domain-containing protein n=1 Tax=Vibrio splendidus TaxID=29497 RepID=UPI000D372A19|nr:type II secretion system protein [Vibrio splendidus]PTP27184.1 MSHA biogenesis protein MshA [Vibrio splendidus]
MKKQGGFTLIELVVVIVILGILAVTAAPRFLNLQTDARESSLQGLKGAMAGAAGIVYGKAAINGVETAETKTVVDEIDTIYGYPMASATGIGEAVDGLSSDWSVVSTGVGTGSFIAYTFKEQKESSWSVTEGCFVRYQEATSSAIATATVINTKC